jgi:hypothetical protein
VNNAIARETQIKKWRREKKVALIEARNPTWEDLADGWGTAVAMTRADSSPSVGMTRGKGSEGQGVDGGVIAGKAQLPRSWGA